MGFNSGFKGLMADPGGRPIVGITGMNPAETWMSVCCGWCVLSGRGLFVRLITRPEES